MSKLYKSGRRANTITQKAISIRVDNDLLDWLKTKENKGRYINNLIRNDLQKNKNEM